MENSRRKASLHLRKWTVRVFEHGKESISFMSMHIAFTAKEAIYLTQDSLSLYSPLRGTGVDSRSLQFPLRFVATEEVDG